MLAQRKASGEQSGLWSIQMDDMGWEEVWQRGEPLG